LETLDAVLDVGGAYDPASDLNDHHQDGFWPFFWQWLCLLPS